MKCVDLGLWGLSLMRPIPSFPTARLSACRQGLANSAVRYTDAVSYSMSKIEVTTARESIGGEGALPAWGDTCTRSIERQTWHRRSKYST